MEPWMAVDVHNGGLEAQNGALEGLYTSGRRFVEIWIRFHIKVVRIRNPGFFYLFSSLVIGTCKLHNFCCIHFISA
jgi:hypothetical protein